MIGGSSCCCCVALYIVIRTPNAHITDTRKKRAPRGSCACGQVDCGIRTCVHVMLCSLSMRIASLLLFISPAPLRTSCIAPLTETWKRSCGFCAHMALLQLRRSSVAARTSRATLAAFAVAQSSQGNINAGLALSTPAAWPPQPAHSVHLTGAGRGQLGGALHAELASKRSAAGLLEGRFPDHGALRGRAPPCQRAHAPRPTNSILTAPS